LASQRSLFVHCSQPGIVLPLAAATAAGAAVAAESRGCCAAE
jgi:hypothetical protein